MPGLMPMADRPVGIENVKLANALAFEAGMDGLAAVRRQRPKPKHPMTSVQRPQRRKPGKRMRGMGCCGDQFNQGLPGWQGMGDAVYPGPRDAANAFYMNGLGADEMGPPLEQITMGPPAPWQTVVAAKPSGSNAASNIKLASQAVTTASQVAQPWLQMFSKQPKPTAALVAPSQSTDFKKIAMIVGGVALVGVIAYMALKK